MGWPIMRIDDTLIVREASATALALLDVPVGDACGRPISEVLGVTDRLSFDTWARAGWLGCEERVWSVANGRQITLRIAVEAVGWEMLLVDVTSILLLQNAEAMGERGAAVAGLASAVSQELNDPMSIVQGRLELLEAIGTTNAEIVDRHLGIALAHARRVSGSLHNLRLVGRGLTGSHASVQLVEALNGAVKLVGPRASAIHVDVLPPELAAGAEFALISRVAVDMIRAALSANADRGGITVKARRAEGGRVRIVVSTRMGRRVPEGAALAIDRTLLWSAGGELVVDDSGGLSRWTLFLPSPARRRVRRHKPSGRLLVVGTEAFSQDVRELLDRDGLEIIAAPDVPAALAVLGSNPEVAGVLSELLLPGSSGLALMRAVGERWPALADSVLIATDTALETEAVAAGWLAKPVSRLALLRGLGRRAR